MFEKANIEAGMLGGDEWQEYRDIWLEALRESPAAFAADYETQVTVPPEVWQQRYADVRREESAVMVFGFVDGVVAGMIGAYFETNPKFRHVATIWGAYVKPRYRSIGVSRKMGAVLFDKLAQKPFIKKIKTYSITSGMMAVSVYKDHHFDIIGIAKKELYADGRYHDVYVMERVLE